MSTVQESGVLQSILNFSESAFDFGFIFFPSIGFLHQYVKINRLKSSFGFSKLISLILLVAYVVRIFFWIGKRFDIILLLQSLVGIITQLLLLHACVKYSENNKSQNDYFKIKDFWDWPYYSDYLFFILLFSTVIGTTSNLVGYENKVFVEILGSMSAISESLLGIPQIWENYSKKDVKTLSYFMIICWFLGDSVKIFYYIKTSSPFQLVLCVFGQLVCDMIIILQIYFYSKNKKNEINIK